jgi:hypothetical protein
LELAATRIEDGLLATNPEALVFTQVAYGLLRNTIRRYGLDASLDGNDAFGRQVVVLWTLLKEVREQQLTLEVGRRTTERRALEAVDENRRDIARGQLFTLAEYGILEEGSGPPFPWIRVNQEWLQGLLELSLGYVPSAWDEDLLARIERLPQPIGPELLEVD